MKKIFPIVLFILFVVSASAQNMPPGSYSSTNKKAISLFEESKNLFRNRQDAAAEKKIQKAIEEDPNFIEAVSAYADFLMMKKRPKEAVENYKKAIQINPKFMVDNNFYLAKAYQSMSDFDNAKLAYEAFLKYERISPNLKEESLKQVKNCEFASTLVKNPRPIKPINAGAGINTVNDEYFPAITADGSLFMFTRALPRQELPGAFNEDFFTSAKVKGVWQTATPLSNINSAGNEGAPTLSADGNIMLFASCADEYGDYGSADRKGLGSCDIFYSQKVNGKWTKPRNAGTNVNTANWETQPSFSSDGKTLYFIQGLKGRGTSKSIDIYSSTIGEDGRFQTPVKLNSNVNSSGNEESVFIHPDNMTLYFASDGHPGLGGTDLFMSRRQPNGDWGPAINLGYPINTAKDDNSFLVDPSGTYAYFASEEREGGFGGLDIYQFEMPQDIRPEKITYAKGKIYNAKTKAPLEANFEVFDLETGNNITKSYSDLNGEFFVTLTAKKNYLVNVNKSGFLFYSENFSLKNKETDFNKPYIMEIPLEPIDTGSVVELKNVFFDVDKWDLKPESKSELTKLAQFLTANQSLRIELGGHTDSDGNKKSNLILSTNRAKAVHDYLVTTGKIDDERLSFKGYGDTKPKVPNTTPENKAKNRRTEFKVTGK